MKNNINFNSEIVIKQYCIYRPEKLSSNDNKEEGFNPKIYFICGLEKRYFSGYKILEKTPFRVELEIESEKEDKIKITVSLKEDYKDKSISKDRRYLNIGDTKYSAVEVYNDFLDSQGFPNIYNIFYIGQAKGNSERDAFDRLKKHEKLQEIVSKSNANELDYEIFVFVCEFTERKFISNLSFSQLKEFRIIPQNMVEPEKEISDIRNGINNSMNNKELGQSIIKSSMDMPLDKEYINLLEAGLINYFKPNFNDTFVGGTVPKLKDKSYSGYYKKDYDLLIINLSNMGNIIFQTDSVKLDVQESICKNF